MMEIKVAGPANHLVAKAIAQSIQRELQLFARHSTRIGFPQAGLPRRFAEADQSHAYQPHRLADDPMFLE